MKCSITQKCENRLYTPSARLPVDFGNDKQDKRTQLSLLTVSKGPNIGRFISLPHSHQRVDMPIFTTYSCISYDTNTDIKLFEKCIANTIHPVLAVYVEVLLCKRAIGEHKAFRSIITDWRNTCIHFFELNKSAGLSPMLLQNEKGTWLYILKTF